MAEEQHSIRSLLLQSWLLLAGILLAGARSVEGLGVNWGTQATHRLPPATVVQMLLDNGINKVKLFDADFATMSALAGTGIEVMVAIPNDMLAAMTDYSNAQSWVQINITRFNWHGGVNIKYVAVGNEPFLTSYNGSFVNETFPALQNIQKALNEAGAGDTVKATIPHNADVYGGAVPSAGRFRADIAGVMTQIVAFLNGTGAPFTVNIYPFLSLYGNPGFPVSYAFFDGGATTVVDGGVTYTNVFDANYDTLVSSLKAIGFGDLPVVVGEIGWPTDGGGDASVADDSMAQRFYAGLLRRLAGNVGTPLRPNASIEVYLFSLFDEDGKSIAPGDFERHWGIFGYNGQPKYPIDFSCNSSNTLPAPARDVAYLPQRWCVFDPNSTAVGNATMVKENVDYACTFSDCTALAAGSSCGGLDSDGKASYAFNMYYQVQNQEEGSCDFQGLAMVTTQNYSQGDCGFIVQLDSSASSRRSSTPPAMSVIAAAAVALLVGIFFLW